MLRQVALIAGSAAVFCCLLGFFGFAVGAGASVHVSQKGRAFVPRDVTIKTGDVLTIRNDDEYVHDVMVHSPDFSFDSGEQQIGQNVEITFPHSGEYAVLCAIHPKMRLDVHVQ